MIRLALPAVLASALAGLGVYGFLARRNAVLVLIGAELMLAAAGVLLVAGSLASAPRTGLSQAQVEAGQASSGQVATIMLITISAAEVVMTLAVIMLLYRARGTSDLQAVRELGEGSPTYSPNGFEHDPAQAQNAQAQADVSVATSPEVAP